MFGCNFLKRSKQILLSEKNGVKPASNDFVSRVEYDKLLVENGRLQHSQSILMKKYDELLNVSNKIMTTNEMFDTFTQSLKEAEREIDIMVPWMSDHVVGKLKVRLESILQKGIKIKIRSGFNANPIYQASSFMAFDIFEEFKRDYKNLAVEIDSIIGASSVLIIDDDFYIVGGFNFLGIDEESSPKEVGVCCTEKNKLEALRLRYFDF